MKLSFTLSMPNIGSWNGKWTGEGNLYARVSSFVNSKKANEKAQKILDGGYYHYNFGDGWSAGITVKKIDDKEARKIKKHTKGFYGYEWMIDSIKDYGEILNTNQRKERREAEKNEQL